MSSSHFFRADRKTKIAVLSRLSIKEAYCTQVHDLWSFGPLLALECSLSFTTFKNERISKHTCSSVVFIHDSYKVLLYKVLKDKKKTWCKLHA